MLLDQAVKFSDKRLSDLQQQIYDSIYQQMSQSLRDNIRCRGLNVSRMQKKRA